MIARLRYYWFACVIAAMTLSPAAVSADDRHFFEAQISNWAILGQKSVDSRNPTCSAEKTWTDGSFWTIYHDLKDQEPYFVIRNVDWSFSRSEQDRKEFSARLNFRGARGGLEGGAVSYEILSKDSIRVRNLYRDRFVPQFMKFANMLLVMPGSHDNLGVDLRG